MATRAQRALYAAAGIPAIVACVAAPTAAAAGNADIYNDYGQTPAQVDAEIATQVSSDPTVVAAKAAMDTAVARAAAAKTADAAAKAAYKKAVARNKAAAIKAAKAKATAAHKVYVQASAAAAKAKGAYTAAVSTATARIRAAHYTPVDGTYTGDLAKYFIPENGLEPMQVEVTVYGGAVTDVTAVQYINYGESGAYNRMALPTLISEAIEASGSADIASVTGATLTSEAFAKSLRSALTKAGFPASS